MRLGAGAEAAETFYSEPESEPEPFKTFDQFHYDLLLTKYCRYIFPYDHFIYDLCLRSFVTYHFYLTIINIRSFSTRSFSLRSFAYDILSYDLLQHTIFILR